MSLTSRAAGALMERRGASPYLEWGTTAPPPPGSVGGGVGGLSVTTESASQIAAVYGCCALLADSVASLPLRALDAPAHLVTSKETKTVPTLLENPFELISLTDWLIGLIWALALRGNYFGRIVERDRLGFPTQIMPVNPDIVRPQIERDGSVKWFFAGKVVRTEDVFHIRYQSMPGQLLGMNPIQCMKYSFGLAHATDVWAANYYQNSGNPQGVIEVQGQLNPAATKQMAADWIAAHQGLNKSNLPAVLTEGAKFNPITINPADQQLLEARKYSAEEISGIVFRIPPHMVGLNERSTCLPAGSQVFTEMGPRPIETIHPGERVWSLDEGQARFRLAKVNAQRQTGCDPILTIRTKCRTLRVNAKHKVLVRRKTPDPQPGIGRYRCVRWHETWIAAGELDVGDILITAHGLPASENRTAPNGREVSVGFMEFCGLLIGDGNVLAGAVTVARHREARYMDAYRRTACAEFTRCAKGGTLVAARRKSMPIRLREYERCTVFSSVTAVAELCELGMSGTAHTKRVPGWVFTLAPELQLAFLRGYADADGHVSERGEMIFCSANRALLEDVRHLCMMLGVAVGGIGHSDAAGTGLIKGRSLAKHRMYRLNCCDADANLRIGSHDPKDAARLRRAKRSPRRQWFHHDYQGRGPSPDARPGTHFGIEGAALQYVTSIEESAPEPVYDLTVDGTHTFLADGLVVHNSFGRGIEQQERGFVANTLSGYLVRAERALTSCLPPGTFANFDISRRIRGSELERAQTASLLMLAGMANADMLLGKFFDMPPLPNGEGKFVNSPINTELLQKQLLEIAQMKKAEDEPAPEPEDVPTNGKGNAANVPVPK